MILATDKLTNQQYHADLDQESSSSLELFRKDVLKYAAIRVHRTMQPDEPTPEMRFGTMFHTLVLELQEFPNLYEVATNGHKKSKKKLRDLSVWSKPINGHKTRCPCSYPHPAHDYCDGNPDAYRVVKEKVTADDMALAISMAKAIEANPMAYATLQEPGLPEHTLPWVDDETGLPLKCRTDKILTDKRLIVDLKTTTDVSEDAWSRTVHRYGYYRQAALYREGVRSVLGIECDFLFVAVSKEPPHEAVCYMLDEEAMQAGDMENRETIRNLADRRSSGNWESTRHDQIITVGLPAWALRRRSL